MAGLFTSTSVEIPRMEYVELLRESEQNDTIRRLLQKNKYISIEDLKTILCVEDEEVPKEVLTFEEMLGEKESGGDSAC